MKLVEQAHPTSATRAARKRNEEVYAVRLTEYEP